MSTSLITQPTAISSYNRGPLTSAFIAPPSCLSTLTSVNDGVMYFGHMYSSYVDTACYPAPTDTAVGIGDDLAWHLYYYSPAIACPSGWSKATTFTSTFGGNGITLSLSTSTTAVLCCPSGYTFSVYDHRCASDVPSGATATFTYINPTQVGNSWTFPGLQTVTHTAVSSSDWQILGDGIPIWWQSSDQVALSSPTVTSAFLNTAMTSQSAPTSTPTITPGHAPKGLSTCATVAIVAGATLLGIVISVFAILFCLFVRKRRMSRGTNATGTQGEVELQEVELHSTEMIRAPEELEGREPFDTFKYIPFWGTPPEVREGGN